MARPKKGITFWNRVYSHVVSEGECWSFTGCKDDCGYGRINKDGRLVRLHRAIYEHHHGPVPKELVVRHKCDNRACLRIDHLEIGTQADNIADMDNRGRRISLIGTENWQAKLNEAQVVAIKARLAAGEKCAPISREYGVNDRTIASIRDRKSWKHVA